MATGVLVRMVYQIYQWLAKVWYIPVVLRYGIRHYSPLSIRELACSFPCCLNQGNNSVHAVELCSAG